MASWSGIDFILRMVSAVTLARLLIPEYFGLVAMVTAVTGMAVVISDLGLSSATVQREKITHKQVSNLFWINTSAGFLFFLFFCAISYGIEKFYEEPRLLSITVAISTTFIFSGLTVQHEALLSRQIKQGQLAVIRVSADFLSIIAAILLAIGGYGYWSLVLREIFRSLLSAAGLWIYCPWVPGLPSKGAGMRELLRFGRDLSTTHLLIGIISRLDGLIVGRFFGAGSLGLYRQAYNLMMVPIDQLNGPILSVAQPGLSRLQSDPERYRRYYQRMLFFITAATIPIGIIVAVFSQEITLMVLGEKWIDSSAFLRVFGIAAAIRPAIGTSAIVLITCGKSSMYLFVAVAHSVVFLVLLLVGVQWGAIGVAIAHVSTTLVLLVPKLYFSFLKTPISLRLFYKTTRSPIIAGMFMLGFLIVYFNFKLINEMNFSYITLSVICGSIYVTVLVSLSEGREYVIALYRDVVISLWNKRFYGNKAGA
jgi:PST family polysaccharide transporter